MKFTEKEIAIIQQFYWDEGAKYCADLIPGKNRKQVGVKARSMGLRYGGPKLGTYEKGNIPANKGKKMPAHVYEKAKATMFIKGQKAHNAKHDNCICIRKDKNGNKYKHIRVSEGNWKHLHRVIWEKANGRIPNDCIVRFIDGDSMNCALPNLELMPKAKNAIFNMNAAYPRPLQETIYQYHQLKNELHHAKK